MVAYPGMELCTNLYETEGSIQAYKPMTSSKTRNNIANEVQPFCRRIDIEINYLHDAHHMPSISPKRALVHAEAGTLQT